MTPDRTNTYLDDLARALRARGAYSRNLIDEMRDHLLDRTEAAREQGLSYDDAQDEAIAKTGPPEVVARHAAIGVSSFRRGALLGTCVATLGSVGLLSISLLILTPPHASYGTWSAVATLVAVLTTATFAWARTGDLASRWSRPLLLLGNLALAAFGAATLYRNNATNHFDGYGLILGVLLSLQAVLTLVHLQPLPHLRRT